MAQAVAVVEVPEVATAARILTVPVAEVVVRAVHSRPMPVRAACLAATVQPCSLPTLQRPSSIVTSFLAMAEQVAQVALAVQEHQAEQAAQEVHP